MNFPLGVLPAINREEEPFWQYASEGKLMVPQCVQCFTHVFPPRSFCATCTGTNLMWVEVAMPGVVYSCTTNYNVWEEGSDVPYSLVVVDLPNASHIRMIGLYEGSAEPEIDQLVNVSFAAGPGGLTRPIFTPWTTS